LKNNKVVKDLFLICTIVFALPSIIYIISGKSIFLLDTDYNYLLNIENNKILATIIFTTLFSIISILYLLILKNCNNIFDNIKRIFKFILIISLIFAIMLPYTSTDIYYYMSTGWSQKEYGVNPYYTSVKELTKNNIELVKNDKLLLKIPAIWSDTTIVYGPLWPAICNILTGLSFGNLNISLMIFKLFNILIHMLCCFFIWKITKRKILVVLYGLNPLILFEGLSNVHNDILVVLFIIVSIYFLKNRKQIIPAIIFLALATTVKYYAILFVPFITIYYLKKLNLKERILYCCRLASIFLIVIVLIYSMYIRDVEVFKGLITQQSKFSKSIFLILYLFMNEELAIIFSKIALAIFLTVYLIKILKYLLSKEKDITFMKIMKTQYGIMLSFIFLVITNFQTWYIMWMFPFILWQTSNRIKNILFLTISSEISISIFMILGQHYSIGAYYLIIIIFISIIFQMIYSNKQIIRYNKSIK
jgi:alpha-1,6-mannosyltransferase